MCIYRIIFLIGAFNNHNDSFPFFLSLFSFCAPHRFQRARAALSCYSPWFVPFPVPSFFPALSILSALGALGDRVRVAVGRGYRRGWGRGSGSGFVSPRPLIPLEEGDFGSRGLLVGVDVLGVGGFGHLLLLGHISQSVLGVVACCLLA